MKNVKYRDFSSMDFVNIGWILVASLIFNIKYATTSKKIIIFHFFLLHMSIRVAEITSL